MVVWRPNEPIKAVKMPKDLNAIKDFVNYYKDVAKPLVFLEKLSIRPDDIADDGTGKNKGKIYRIQVMMQNFEQLKAILTVSGIPYVLVHPMTWQSRLKVRMKGEEKPDRKRRFKDIAEKLYPIKQTLWSADATLIMHFGRYILANDINWVKENLPKAVQGNLFR